jgi:hypothetical protein
MIARSFGRLYLGLYLSKTVLNPEMPPGHEGLL